MKRNLTLLRLYCKKNAVTHETGDLSGQVTGWEGAEMASQSLNLLITFSPRAILFRTTTSHS